MSSISDKSLIRGKSKTLAAFPAFPPAASPIKTDRSHCIILEFRIVHIYLSSLPTIKCILSEIIISPSTKENSLTEAILFQQIFGLLKSSQKTEMEDFNKPKVMWKIIGCNINFSFDEEKMICNNAVNIMTGKRDQLVQFVGLMNSILFDWYLKLTTEAEVQGGGIQLYVTTLEKTLLKLDFSTEFTSVIHKRIQGIIDDTTLNSAVFDIYNLNDVEQKYIINCKNS